MKSRRRVLVAAAIAILACAAIYAYWKWNKGFRDPRTELLAALPFNANTEAVVYLNAVQLGHSAFLKRLVSWAAKPAEDPDYEQFVRETGFDYEHDLGAAAIAILDDGKISYFYAVAKGRFDEKKIAEFAAHNGQREEENGHAVFRVPIGGEKGEIQFTFQGPDRIALTNGPELFFGANQAAGALDSGEWRVRFERLAGSPVFAVIRRDTQAASALAEAAPGGFRSPQLASLLSQLSWITVAGKPDGPQMEVVAEGETPDSSLAWQLSDFLNGIVVMAQAGLNDPTVQEHLNAATAVAYQQFLKSADISRIDRGATKSVRVVLTITPQLLESARAVPSPAAPSSQPREQQVQKPGKHNPSKPPAKKH